MSPFNISRLHRERLLLLEMLAPDELGTQRLDATEVVTDFDHLQVVPIRTGVATQSFAFGLPKDG